MRPEREITLLSGPKAVITTLTPNERKILTQDSEKDFATRLYQVLGNITVDIEGVDLKNMKPLDKIAFFTTTLSADNKKILLESRALTYDDDPIFDFEYEYETPEGNVAVQSYEEDISKGFPFQSMRKWQGVVDGFKHYRDILKAESKTVLGEDGLEEPLLKPTQYNNYQEVLANMFIEATLPKSGIKIRLRYLTGKGELSIASLKANQLNLNTQLMMRSPSDVSGDTPILLMEKDIDRMPLPDVDFMQALIKVFEPKIHTECRFLHPLHETRVGVAKYVNTDLFMQPSFFFPTSVQ